MISCLSASSRLREFGRLGGWGPLGSTPSLLRGGDDRRGRSRRRSRRSGNRGCGRRSATRATKLAPAAVPAGSSRILKRRRRESRGATGQRESGLALGRCVAWSASRLEYACIASRVRLHRVSCTPVLRAARRARGGLPARAASPSGEERRVRCAGIESLRLRIEHLRARFRNAALAAKSASSPGKSIEIVAGLRSGLRSAPKCTLVHTGFVGITYRECRRAY
jgi:hypothetical protein